MKIGQWVRYTYKGHVPYNKIGQITHSSRGLTYVTFFGGETYGCYPDFLEPLPRRERAIAIAKKALGIDDDQQG